LRGQRFDTITLQLRGDGAFVVSARRVQGVTKFVRIIAEVGGTVTFRVSGEGVDFLGQSLT
jgi:hypothetical protein